MPRANTARGRYNRLSAVISLDDTTLVRALGGLVCYMQSTLFRLDSAQVSVHRVRNARDMSFMSVDLASLRALHIFKEERHPGATKGKNNHTKEGMCPSARV